MGHIEDRNSSDDGDTMEFSVKVDSFMIPDSVEVGQGRPFKDFLQSLEHAPNVYVNSASLGDFIKVDKDVVINRVNQIFERDLHESLEPVFFVDDKGNIHID